MTTSASFRETVYVTYNVNNGMAKGFNYDITVCGNEILTATAAGATTFVKIELITALSG